MNWLYDLIAGSTIAHALFIYSIVIAVGVILGKVKIFGISLGATFVLFVGIIAGHFGHIISPDEAFINHNTLKFIQEFWFDSLRVLHRFAGGSIVLLFI